MLSRSLLLRDRGLDRWARSRAGQRIAPARRPRAPTPGGPRAAHGGRPLLDSPGPQGGPTIDVNASGPLVLVLAALVLVLLLVVAWSAWAVVGLRRRLDALTRGASGADLEDVLLDHLRQVEGVATDLRSLEARTAFIEQEGRFAVQRVGFVRFNPFEDTGGNQSFALALLDANHDGIVVSSLHTRQATRVYAKGISTGRSDSALSDEETEALRLAMSGRRTPA